MAVDNEELQRWRGAIHEKVTNHDTKLEEHGQRLDRLTASLNEVTTKLAVPLFLSSIVGVVIGGFIVAALTGVFKR